MAPPSGWESNCWREQTALPSGLESHCKRDQTVLPSGLESHCRRSITGAPLSGTAPDVPLATVGIQTVELSDKVCI